MSPRARPFAFGLGRSFFALAAAATTAAFAGCAPDAAPVAIAPEPRAPAPSHLLSPHAEDQGAKAATYTIDYPPLGFSIAIALPEDGQLCIILPESAQEPTACMGLDPGAMIDALPEGPERPFGVAYARMGEWSYVVLLSPIGTGIETREDVEVLVDQAVKGVRQSSSLEPKLVVDTPNQKFDLMRVKNVPVVKFRIDAPHLPDSPQYDLATTLHYGAFGGKSVMVTFLTSPEDAGKVLPYAEATVQSLVLPPHDAPERFGKPRAELDTPNTRTAIMIIGPLLALGALLFLWLARSKPAEATAEKPNGAPSGEDAPSSDEDEDEADEKK